AVVVFGHEHLQIPSSLSGVSPCVPRNTVPHAPSGLENLATVFGSFGSSGSREKSDGMSSLSLPSRRLTVVPVAPALAARLLLESPAASLLANSGSSFSAVLKSALAPAVSPLASLVTARL